MSIMLMDAGPGTGKSFALENIYRILTHQTVGRLEPTDEQAAIFQAAKDEYAHCKSFAFFSLNTSTRDKLKAKLPKNTQIQTFHGAGSSAIKKNHRFQKLHQGRSEMLISDITGQLVRDMDRDEKSNWLAVKRLVMKLKLENLEPTEENFEYLNLKYPDVGSLTFPDDWEDRASKLIDVSSRFNGYVDFTDMLWLGMRCTKSPVYDLGFVDESQDISNCAFQLVNRLCRNIIFCGDRNQAINAFAGASEEMYQEIEKLSDGVLPLKMTLRCPHYICDMANMVRPKGVIKNPTDFGGEHKTISYTLLPEKLRETTPRNSLIISRTNAAVISCALYLYKQGLKVQIVDKDLAEEVLFFLKGFFTQNLSKLLERVNAYQDKHSRSKNELWAAFAVDKCTWARELITSVSTWEELNGLIKETFEKHPDGYPLSTIHKSKGMEASNIFILNPPIELEVAMKHPIGREQEVNLHFVALTRCMKNLTWVTK